MIRRKFKMRESMYTYDVEREDGAGSTTCTVLFSVVAHPAYLVRISINGEALQVQRFNGIPDHVKAFVFARKAYEDLPYDLKHI